MFYVWLYINDDFGCGARMILFNEQFVNFKLNIVF